MRTDFSKIRTHLNNDIRILTEYQFNCSSANSTKGVLEYTLDLPILVQSEDSLAMLQLP